MFSQQLYISKFRSLHGFSTWVTENFIYQYVRDALQLKNMHCGNLYFP
jgi:hypothetical protein